MLVDFLNIDISKELELDSLPDEDRRELESKLNEALNKRIGVTLAGLLSEEEQETFNDVPDEETEDFLRKHIANFDVVVAEIAAEFRKEVLEMVASVKRARVETSKY